MGEDIDTNHKLFELPANGNVVLPEFQAINTNEVPAEVSEQIRFEEKMQELSETKLIGAPYLLDFGVGGKSYVLAYNAVRDFGYLKTFHVVNEVDLAAHGKIMGAGMSFLELDDNGKEEGEPYVQYTFTNPDYERQGLGLRRLLILNSANKLFFDKALTSGSFVDPGVENTWKKLESAGIVMQPEPHLYNFK